MEDLTGMNNSIPQAPAKSKIELVVSYAVKFLLAFSGLCVGAVIAIVIALLTGLADITC